MKIFSIKEIIDILNKLSHKIKCLCQSLTKGHVMLEDLTLPNQSISEMDASGITNSSFFPFIKPAAGKGGYENFKISKANLASALGGGGGATPISTDISNATTNVAAAGEFAAKQYIDSKKTLIGTTTGNDSTDELLIQGARIAFDLTTGDALVFGPNDAGLGNTGNGLTAIGNTAALSNIGNEVTAIGSGAATNNTGNGLTAIGGGSAAANSGANVTAIGNGTAGSNTFSNVNLFGVNSQATTDNQTVFGNLVNPIQINHAVIQNTAKSLKITIGATDYWVVLATSEPI